MPRPAQLSEGATLAVAFTLAGTPETFDRGAFSSALLRKFPAAEAVSLNVTAASIRVDATLTMPSIAAATAAADVVAGTSAAELTVELGVTVEAVSAPTVETLAPTTSESPPAPQASASAAAPPPPPSTEHASVYITTTVLSVAILLLAVLVAVLVTVFVLRSRRQDALARSGTTSPASDRPRAGFDNWTAVALAQKRAEAEARLQIL